MAEGRVTAIDGAYEALGVEPAQAALRRRIHDWDDQRAASLLRTLIALGRARVEAAVLEVFARGCLLACFESPADASTAASQGSPRPELAEEISALARALEADAEGQELSDALRNAAAFRRAGCPGLKTRCLSGGLHLRGSGTPGAGWRDAQREAGQGSVAAVKLGDVDAGDRVAAGDRLAGTLVVSYGRARAE